jgi:glycosyltransferase A (GT-A) superfamily protein (DUF2064 family)
VPPPLSPAVLVMARAPEAGLARPELRELLGDERCAALERVLLARVADWAGDVAPGRVLVAHRPAAAEESVRRVVGDEAQLFGQEGAAPGERLGGAVERAFAVTGGPVLVVWPDLPQWRAEHAASALDDLDAGCGVAVGPVFDGGFYMLALAAPVPAVFGLPDEAWDGPDALGLALGAVHEAGLEAGLLRPERALHRPADVRAALADPLLDPELAAILRGR